MQSANKHEPGRRQHGRACWRGSSTSGFTRVVIKSQKANFTRASDNARVTIDERNKYAVKEHGITPEKNDVETVLRAIRDYLEEQSFREVIP